MKIKNSIHISKLAIKIAIPIILVGLFTVVVLISVGYEQLEPGFYIVALFLVVFVFFFGLSVGQNISSFVKKLLDKAVELSEGNLSGRVDLDTKDELSDLARAFNKIAEDLEKSRLQEEDAEKSVSIKVKAKTNELEETINALEQKVKNRTIELGRSIEELSNLKEIIKNKESKIA